MENKAAELAAISGMTIFPEFLVLSHVALSLKALFKQISTMQKGAIRVQTENIFPIIKKFLYSDHEIFLRELISNAVDATQKLKPSLP